MIHLMALLAQAGPLEDAQADLRDLSSFLEHVHPGVTAPLLLPGDLDPTPVGVTRAAAQLCASLGDGHLEVGWAQGMDRNQLLPVRPVWVGERAVIIAGPPDLVGRELLAIDGQSAASVHLQMADLIAVDGGRYDPLDAALSRDPWRFLHLVVPPAPRFLLTLGPDEEVVEVAAISDVSALATRPEVSPSWTHDPAVSILRVPAMSAAPDFEERVEQGFSALDSERLIVDLRGNQGGHRDRGAWIVSHLVEEPPAQWASWSLEVQPVPRRLRKHVTVPFGLPERPIRQLLRRGQSTEHLGDPLVEVISPRTSRFEGSVELWVDGLTESAAIEAAVSLLHLRPDVRVVGEPTAGACSAHMGEIPVVFTTPRFRVPVLLSLQQIQLVDMRGCELGQGLPLDERVEWTLEDVVQGRDPWTASP